MAARIKLRFPSRCYDCGVDLPVGAAARWFGKGRVSCDPSCVPADARRPAKGTRDDRPAPRPAAAPSSSAAAGGRPAAPVADGSAFGWLEPDESEPMHAPDPIGPPAVVEAERLRADLDATTARLDKALAELESTREDAWREVEALRAERDKARAELAALRDALGL